LFRPVPESSTALISARSTRSGDRSAYHAEVKAKSAITRRRVNRPFRPALPDGRNRKILPIFSLTRMAQGCDNCLPVV
jgi:hypothetical protein